MLILIRKQLISTQRCTNWFCAMMYDDDNNKKHVSIMPHVRALKIDKSILIMIMLIML